ncbi:MAG: dihydrolipoyl dehydrogenase [Actinobacteria bacterium]|nr:dihydrolipoyl dehydrogenase [Actinomycetota bacterium]
MDRYELIILGGGPGGYVAAIRAAQLGKRVAIVEKDRFGGVCLNRGCIPTKAMLASSHLFDLIKRSQEFGIKVDSCSLDLVRLMERKEKVVSTLRKGVEFLLKSNNVDMYRGFGKLISDNRVEIAGDEAAQILEGAFILIATGSEALVPSAFAYDKNVVITSDEALEMKDIPRSVVVVGGSAVGLEFATIYNIFGANVTLVEMLPQIAPTEDLEISDALLKSMKKRGIDIKTSTKVLSAKAIGSAAEVEIESAGVKQKLKADVVLVAVGRKPNTQGISAEEIGLELERGFIKVDERFRTSRPNVYAIGDVIGGMMLAHIASHEGMAAVENMFGESKSIDYSNAPSCIYTDPEIASVGLSEQKSKEMGYDYKVGKFPFSANGKALGDGEREGFVKVISDARYGEILGVHIFGAHASALLHEAVVAKAAELTVDSVSHVIHIHPSLSETVMEAFMDVYGISIHNPGKGGA